MNLSIEQQNNAHIIQKAIQFKKGLAFQYQGFRRFICPHLLGETKDGRVVCHGFQIGGDSSKGPVSISTGAWRYFYLDEMQDEANPALVIGWHPEPDLKKAEKPYEPPKFITRVIAMAAR